MFPYHCSISTEQWHNQFDREEEKRHKYVKKTSGEGEKKRTREATVRDGHLCEGKMSF